MRGLDTRKLAFVFSCGREKAFERCSGVSAARSWSLL